MTTLPYQLLKSVILTTDKAIEIIWALDIIKSVEQSRECRNRSKYVCEFILLKSSHFNSMKKMNVNLILIKCQWRIK